MNSHLIIPEVWPVGSYTSMCELPLGGKKRALWWVATGRLFAVIVSRKRNVSVFAVFPGSQKTVDRKDRGNQES